MCATNILKGTPKSVLERCLHRRQTYEGVWPKGFSVLAIYGKFFFGGRKFTPSLSESSRTSKTRYFLFQKLTFFDVQ